MKLMNREPTEEMIKAACAVKGMKYESYNQWWIDHFQAMYDAAPEIATNSDYSAEQVATLQAENERLRKANKNVAVALDTLATSVYELTTERDELLNHLKYWLPKEPPFFGVPHSQDVEIAKDIEQYGKTASMIAKYEGEKHG